MDSHKRRRIEELVKELDSDEAAAFLRSLARRKLKRKKTRIAFPEITIIAFGIPQVCISRKDAIRHMAEVFLPDCDKKPVATLKGQVVEALVTLAELIPVKKEHLLHEAAKFILIQDRVKVMKKLATYATYNP